jgi:hydroxymethylbilane synthase
MSQKPIIIATRESQLALWQANWAMKCIKKAHPEVELQLLPMSTQADKAPYMLLKEIGNKGLFVKELEEALLDGRADIAIHCMKDMPVDLPVGLAVTAMSGRDDPFDVMISNVCEKFADLPVGSVVGTSSLRRSTQLLHLRPDLTIKPLRGNVITRLSKLDQGDYAAIILAAAGLRRLGLLYRLNYIFDAQEFLPAAGQGVLGMECRADDALAQSLVATMHDAASYACVTAERSMCKQLGAHCQAPVAAFATVVGAQLKLQGLVASMDGQTILRATALGDKQQPAALGIKVGDELIAQGALTILHGIK